jgi:phosphonate transport system permease protein
VNASGGLRAMLLAQGAELRRRYPEMLVVGWREVPPLALCAAAIGVYFVGLMILDIAPAKIVLGIGRLFDIVELMLPPDPESWARVLLYLGALGQTLAIAFLGTMLGAALGFPFGLLAARNVVANRLIQLLTRRSLDTVRSVDILIWALIWINVVGLGPVRRSIGDHVRGFGGVRQAGFRGHRGRRSATDRWRAGGWRQPP